MLYSLYDFRIRENSKFGVSEYYNQLGIYQLSCASLLEPRQSNLSNPETYSDPGQASKIECFAKIING